MTEFETTIISTLDKILEQATITSTWLTVLSGMGVMAIILSFAFMKR